MSTKSRKTRFDGVLEAVSLFRDYFRLSEAGPPEAGAELIEDFELRVGCRCPCGSRMLYQLTLVSTADCARCGRTFGIRSIVYYRSCPGSLPSPVVSIGYLFSDAKLAARLPAGGIH